MCIVKTPLVHCSQTSCRAQAHSFAQPGVLFAKLKGVHMRLWIGARVSSRCGVCRQRIVASFLPMRQRLITGGKQRILFMSVGSAVVKPVTY